MTLAWSCALPVLFIATTIPAACSLNTYVALVPSSIRPGTTLRVPIRFLSPPGYETVTVKLMDSKNQTLVNTTDTADGLTFITPELEVPTTVSGGSYLVEVEGTGSIPFKNATYVRSSYKALSIFIQTDKKFYKPGKTVKYRVFVVNSTLDIINPTLNIEIKDPKGNKIAKQTGVADMFGISGELELSELTSLGSWSITAEATEFVNTKTYYSFTVEQYVLPKYEVIITDLPSVATIDMPSLTGTIKAVYVFGKPVKGSLRLQVSVRYPYGFFKARAIVKEYLIDGEVTFDIPISALQTLTRNLEYETFRISAKVTETITGITLYGQEDIRFHENPYKVEFFPNLADYFKTTFNPYDVMLKVVEQDDRPPVAPTDQLVVTVTYFTDTPIVGPVPNRVDVGDIHVQSPFRLGDTIIMAPTMHTLGVDGLVSFNLTIPESAATVSIKAAFKGATAYKELKRFRSPGKVFLQTNLINGGDLKIKDIVVIELVSSEGPVTVQYIVKAKGQVVTTGSARVDTLVDGQYIGTQQIAITRDMIPSARFLAYFVRPDGEIVVDGFNFVVKDMFENKVEISVNTTGTVEPQTPVGIEVTAANDSIVYILGVDKSVLLKGTGNDITHDRVNQEMRYYGNSPWIPMGWGFRSFLPWPIRADDAHAIFNDAQLEVLTDANLHRFEMWNVDQPVLEFGDSKSAGGFGSSRRMFSAMAQDSAMRGGMAGGAPVGQVRSYFPETFVWTGGQITNGRFVFDTKAPDTISTFITNAFALSPTKGLGVAPVTSNLTVFVPFFANVQLPYSIIRGETAIIQVNVFNYYPEQLNVLVKLVGSSDFVGVTVDSQGNEANVTGDLEKCVPAPSGKPVPVFFSVRALNIANMKVQVNISAQNAQRNVYDQVNRYLPVKAEGTTKEKNTPTLLSFKTNTTRSTSIPVTYPGDLVHGSQSITVTVFGDIFGSSLRNLDVLIKLPYGCGEQSMAMLAPGVYAAGYMYNTNRTGRDPELLQKIRDVLRVGVQRQLVYQRNNGSFSTFGDADREGSLWLTAFVSKVLSQTVRYNLTTLDPEIIEKAVKYIISYQQPDGSVINTGQVNNKAMQGATASNLRSLTAYVLIALQEVKLAEIVTDPDTITKLNNAILAATFYLEREIQFMKSDYEMAIGAYALKLVNNNKYDRLLRSLERSNNRVLNAGVNEVYWRNSSSALQIEIASYALMTYAADENTADGNMVLNWLVKQRNGYGGFISTQDTVVGLQALSAFAALVYTDNVNMTIDVYTTKQGVDGQKHSLNLTSSSHDLLQYIDFDGDVDTVTFVAKGLGLAVIDVNMKFNVQNDTDTSIFDLSVNITEDMTTKYTLQACAKYNLPQSRTNMAIIDIGFISGYEPIFDDVTANFTIKRKEMSAGRLVTYFDEIPPFPVCVTVPVQRTVLVAGVKPANVIVYTYYENDERKMTSYLPNSLRTPQLCAICGEACGCPNQSGNTTNTPTWQCASKR